MGDEQVDLALRLDHRAHVMMVGHRNAEIGHPLGELRELVAELTEVIGLKARRRRQRRVDLVLNRAGGLGVDQDWRAERLERLHLREDARLFGLDATLEELAGEPAGDEPSPEL